MKIQIRRSQFWKCHATRDLETSTGKFAAELLEDQRVPRKIQPRLEILNGRQRWIGHSGNIDRHVAATSENGTRDCSANIDIERSVAVQFLHARNKLPHELHRAPRQPHLSVHWRFVSQFFVVHNLWNIQRKIRRQLQGLNFCLLQFAGDRQLLALRLRAQIEAGGLEFWNALAPQVAHLHVESRV